MAGMRQKRAVTIAARLKSCLPAGEGEPSRMDKVAELIAEGYSDSRIQDLQHTAETLYRDLRERWL
jgi:hypothetical protein